MTLLRAQVGAQMVTDGLKGALYISHDGLNDSQKLAEYAKTLSFSDLHAFNGTEAEYVSDPEFAWLAQRNPKAPFETTAKACQLQSQFLDNIKTNVKDAKFYYDSYLEVMEDIVYWIQQQPGKPGMDAKMGSPDLVSELFEQALSIAQDWKGSAIRKSSHYQGNPHVDKAWGVSVAGKLDGVFWRDSTNLSYMKAIAPGICSIGVQVSEFGTPLRPASIPHELGHAIYHNRVMSLNSPLVSIQELVSPTCHEIAATLSELHLFGFQRLVGAPAAMLDRKVGSKPDVLMHAALRSEVEIKLLNDELEMKEVGAYWRDRIYQITDRDDEVYHFSWLSDRHWSMGFFGYYSAYGLAVLKAAEWFDHLPRLKKPHAAEAAEWLSGPFANFCLKRLNYGYQDEDLFPRLFPDMSRTLETYQTWLHDNHHLNL